VLVDQSRWIVARAAPSRSRHGTADPIPPSPTRGFAGQSSAGQKSQVRAQVSPSVAPTRGGPPGVAAHQVGSLRSPEVPGNRDPPVRKSHFPDSAPAVGSAHAPGAATLEWRERAAHFPSKPSSDLRLGGFP